jgi:endonuclease YncB( thermonuclease family)
MNASRHRTRFYVARVLFATVAAAWFIALPGCRDEAPAGYRPTHEQAYYLDVGRIQFDDGDSFMLDGEPVRILGMDTPETRSPAVGIMEDQPYGPAAAESTRVLMTRATLLEWVPDGEDLYGRRLAHVLVDGELLSIKLIEMGLAYETVSYFGDSGYPELADLILKASLTAPKPQFEPPYQWRKKHQKKR